MPLVAFAQQIALAPVGPSEMLVLAAIASDHAVSAFAQTAPTSSQRAETDPTATVAAKIVATLDLEARWPS